jgi:hypothetical protein
MNKQLGWVVMVFTTYSDEAVRYTPVPSFEQAKRIAAGAALSEENTDVLILDHTDSVWEHYKRR